MPKQFTVHVRVDDYEYGVLAKLSEMFGSSKLNPNLSEGARFCIRFTGVLLTLIPEVVMELVLQLKEEELEKLKKEIENGRREIGRSV